MLLQYLNNVSKIDLYTSSLTSVRKSACRMFATTCLAEALPSLLVSTRWKPGRGQSLPLILRYESNPTSALRRVEKLHQIVRKHRITYPQVIAWLQSLVAAEACKKRIPHYKIQQGGELPLCQCGMCQPWECPGVTKICSHLLNHATESINAYIPRAEKWPYYMSLRFR